MEGKSSNKIKHSSLNKNLFWDVDINTLDFEKHARFIIQRVLLKGDLPDWHELKRIYGIERIKNESLQIRYLDKKTLNLLSLIFNIPKEKFRCYNTKLSTRQLWDY